MSRSNDCWITHRRKIAWTAVFGRLGGLGQDPDLADSNVDVDREDKEGWVDVDTERIVEKEAEIERRKRILKGQLAREAARQRDKQSVTD